MTNIGRTFELTEEQEKRIEEWYEKLKPKILKIQKEQFKDDKLIGEILNSGEPYYGAVGGGLQYIFTPTAIGTIVIVAEYVTGEKINVTDFGNW